jgi:hypothetical protein
VPLRVAQETPSPSYGLREPATFVGLLMGVVACCPRVCPSLRAKGQVPWRGRHDVWGPQLTDLSGGRRRAHRRSVAYSRASMRAQVAGATTAAEEWLHPLRRGLRCPLRACGEAARSVRPRPLRGRRWVRGPAFEGVMRVVKPSGVLGGPLPVVYFPPGYGRRWHPKTSTPSSSSHGWEGCVILVVLGCSVQPRSWSHVDPTCWACAMVSRWRWSTTRSSAYLRTVGRPLWRSFETGKALSTAVAQPCRATGMRRGERTAPWGTPGSGGKSGSPSRRPALRHACMARLMVGKGGRLLRRA